MRVSMNWPYHRLADLTSQKLHWRAAEYRRMANPVTRRRDDKSVEYTGDPVRAVGDEAEGQGRLGNKTG